MKKLLPLFLSASLLSTTFTSCPFKQNKPANQLPPDTPWNRFVMETDNGYYYGLDGGIMALRYCEKSNGTDIYLCAKPECAHDGAEICTATYKNMPVSNYLLYDGNIYFAADTSDKNTLGVSFYKAALDGSSLDKITDIKRVKSSDENEMTNGIYDSVTGFIIHKGYAYIPYNIGGGRTYTDFIESGFAKVNIQNGKTEMIVSSDNFTNSAAVKVEEAVGDYVYYNSSSAVSSNNGYFRYNTETGEIQKLKGELGTVLDDTGGHYGLAGIMENTCYVRYVDWKAGKSVDKIFTYDTDSLEQNDFELDISEYLNENGIMPVVLCYDDKLFVVADNIVKVYSDKGEPAGEMMWCNLPEKKKADNPYTQSREYPGMVFNVQSCAVSEEKLYIRFACDMELKGMNFDKSSKTNDYREFVYCCPVNDVISGTGSWKWAYTISY